MSNRENSWDTLRALLMLLGIPFHAALPYSLGVNAPVQSADTSMLAEVLGNLLHSFRMGAFFVVAGYFAAYSIDRKGSSAWWDRRWRNLAIPLAVSLICFIPLLLFVRALDLAEGGPHTDDIFMTLLLVPGGHWTGHLWFLIVLLELSLLTVMLLGHLRQWLTSLANWCASQPVLLLAIFFVPLVLLPRVAIGAAGLDQNAVGVILDVRRFAEYAPYFILGLGLFTSPRFLAHFATLRADTTFVAIGCCVAYAAFDYLGIAVLALVCKAAAGVLMCSLLLALVRRFSTRARPSIAWLVRAAFTIYLFHFPIVCVSAYLLEGVAWPAELRFLIIVITTLATSCLAHLALSRSDLLLLLFNGRPLKATNAATA